MAVRPRLTVREAVERLEALAGPAVPERAFAPLDELVSCILSQHSNDERTYPAFAELRRRYPEWSVLMAAPVAELEAVLKPAGLAREKTKRMRAALSAIFERVGDYSIDHLAQMSDKDAHAWLMALPGVGPKTAAVTLAFAFGRDRFPVDTHVHRVAQRLGWVGVKVDATRAHELLARKVPRGWALRTHLALIRHGRTLCTARSPRCSECPLLEGCPWGKRHQIGYHLSAPKRAVRRMSQPVSAPTIDTSRKHACFGARPYASAIAKQIDRASNAAEFWDRLNESPDLCDEVAALWLRAAALLPDMVERYEAVCDAVLEEPERTAPPSTVAAWAKARWLRAIRESGTDLLPGEAITQIIDDLVRLGTARLSLSLHCVALGELAIGAMGGSQPLRVLCFGNSSTVVEETAMLKSWLDGLRRHGFEIEIEPTAWTWEGFVKYELEHMPMRERYALVSARAVAGNADVAVQVRKVGFAIPLTPERLRELVNMRHRQETEEMRPSHRWRHVTLGFGSLSDVLWIVHVHELRYPTATQAGSSLDIPERIRTLSRAQLINTVERDELLEAWAHLQAVRYRLQWLGLTPEVLPENPAKLARLALAFGYDDGNAFLAYHQRVVELVRSLVDESRERLRG